MKESNIVIDQQVKRMAKEFINEQKQILEEFGDSAVTSKIKEEIASAEKTFQALFSSKEKTPDRKLAARVG